MSWARSDLIIKGLPSQGLGEEALGQAGKFGELLGLARASGLNNVGLDPSINCVGSNLKNVGHGPSPTRQRRSFITDTKLWDMSCPMAIPHVL